MKKNPFHTIIDILDKNLPELLAVYLFGSLADGSAGPQSDVDLAFLTKHKIEKSIIFDLQAELASSLNKDVDLIDLQEASEVMNARIIAYGNKIYQNPEREELIASYEQKAWQAYIYLQENIRPLLEEIKRTGKIYT